MKQSLCQSGLRWLWVVLVVLGLDRLTKLTVQNQMMPYESHPVMPFFNITLAYNKGAAFSFLGTASGWQVWFFGLLAIAISTVLVIWLARLSSQQAWLSIALTCIIGGALGNLWDRISYGHVIDFLDFYAGNLHWPVFNIADSAICIGAFMLVLDAFLDRKQSSQTR